MEPGLSLQVVCATCGCKEIIRYAFLKAKPSHNCGQCAETVDITRQLKAGDEFAKRYGFVDDDDGPGTREYAHSPVTPFSPLQARRKLDANEDAR